MSDVDRLKQAKKNSDPSEVVFAAIGIYEIPYLSFIYDHVYLANRCNEQQFMNCVEAMTETNIQTLAGASHALRFGCKEELAGYLEGINRDQVPYLDEFLLYSRNTKE